MALQTATLTHVLHYERTMFEFERITLQIGDEDPQMKVYVREMTNDTATIVTVDDGGNETEDTVATEQKRLFGDEPDVLAELSEQRKALSHQMLGEGWDMVSNDFKDTSPGFNAIVMYTWTLTFQREGA